MLRDRAGGGSRSLGPGGVGGVPGWRRAGRALASLRPAGPSASKTPATDKHRVDRQEKQPNPEETPDLHRWNRSQVTRRQPRVVGTNDDRRPVWQPVVSVSGPPHGTAVVSAVAFQNSHR